MNTAAINNAGLSNAGLSNAHLNNPLPSTSRGHRTAAAINTGDFLSNIAPAPVGTSPLHTRLNLKSMRTSTRQKIKYYLMQRFSPEKAELKLLTKIEHMVAERKQQLSLTGSSVELEALHLAEVVTELTREIQRSHPLGKAIPWMVEGAVLKNFSPEKALVLVKHRIKNGITFKKEALTQQGIDWTAHKSALTQEFSEHYSKHSAIGRDHPELVQDIILNEIDPDKAQTIVKNFITKELNKITNDSSKRLTEEAGNDLIENSIKEYYLAECYPELIKKLVTQKMAKKTFFTEDTFNNEKTASHTKKRSLTPTELEAKKHAAARVSCDIAEIEIQIDDMRFDHTKDDINKLFKTILSIKEQASTAINRRLTQLLNKSLLEKITEILPKEVLHEIMHKMIQEDLSEITPALIRPKNKERKLRQIISELKANYPHVDPKLLEQHALSKINPEKAKMQFVGDIAQKVIELRNIYRSENKEISDDIIMFFIIMDAKEHFKDHPITSQHPQLLKSITNKLFNSLIQKGVRLDKEDFNLKHSVILSANTLEAYALTNTLNKADTAALKAQFPSMEIIQEGKKVIGKGGFGKVRFAKNIITGNFVAVKKIDTKRDASGAIINNPGADGQEEIDSFRQVGEGKYFVALFDFANLKGKNADQKTYLFIEYVPGENGADFINAHRNSYASDPLGFERNIQFIAKAYIKSAAELHQKGIYHRDIKPDNFLHSNDGNIKIIDYGLSTNKAHNNGAGTSRYMPPESNNKAIYHAEKHDSFSLGISLLEQYSYGKHGGTLTHLNDAHPTSPNKIKINKQKLMIRGKERNIYSGFDNTLAMQGITIEEVIMKLMARNLNERITAREALNLPYFQ